MKQFTAFLITLFALAAFSQSSEKRTLILNAYLHDGTGNSMQGATIGITGNRISIIKSSVSYRHNNNEWDTIIDLQGKHLYPGILAPNSTLGLTEIDAVRATRDFDEVGLLNPHIRSIIAYNVESDVVATVRSNGVLLVQITPRGGWISGTSSVAHLSGWNWEDAAVKVQDGVHVNWPTFFHQNHGAMDGKKEDEQKKKYVEGKRELEQFFAASKAYANQKSNDKIDLRYDAMKACFKGTARVYFHANELQQMLDILDFTRKFELPFPVIIGGYDAYLMLPQLRDAKIPVMLPRVHSLPENEHDPVDLNYRLPALLKEGGVEFCLQNEGDMEAMNARNLPFLAGHTMGYGLTEEEALHAITLAPCKIMGLDDQYGSIEVGKNATFFVSEGPALDMRTNHVIMAMVNGDWISLDDRQKELYRKYQSKYQQKSNN